MSASIKYITRQQARKVDEIALDEFGIPGVMLMENAGRGCADTLCRLGIEGPVVICCGRGNNAGDGFVIARHLELRGYPVKVLLWSRPEQLRGDAAINYRIIEKAGIPIIDCFGLDTVRSLGPHLDGADWVVDGLLGTGADGPPRPPYSGVISVLNQVAAKRLAIDLPSGLDCDSGIPHEPTFVADHTCTFVAPKIGFQIETAKRYLGVVHVLDIGAPKKLLVDLLGFLPSSNESPAK